MRFFTDVSKFKNLILCKLKLFLLISSSLKFDSLEACLDKECVIVKV